MTTHEKNQIASTLAEYCRLTGGAVSVTNALAPVDQAVVSNILNGKWDAVTDDLWLSVARQIGFSPSAWAVVETRGYRRMYDLLADAKTNALVFAVTGEAGCGKSEAIRNFGRNNPAVYVLSCSEYWNRKHFMCELLQSMGHTPAGSTVAEMMTEIIETLKRQERPLIIFDEADKLGDNVLYFFITLYNKLEDHVGIVLCATDYLEKRIKKGVRSNRKGYKEIFSRTGKKFIPIQVVNSEDIRAVCVANGVDDPKAISEIIDDSEHDLRRVKRKIHALRRRSKNL